MTFETYPLPAGNPKLEQVADNIASQHEKLNGVIANLYQGTQQALASQQKALNGTVNRLTRSANGRIKNQAVVLGGVTNTLYGAVAQSIANAGKNLAVQSALLPRLAPAGIAPETGSQPAVNPPAQFSPPGGARGGAPVLPTVPSLPPGVSAPSFPLSPQEIIPVGSATLGMGQPTLPAAPGQPTTFSPAPQPITPPNWMVLANCDVNNWTILDQNDPLFANTIQYGHYVPLRKNFGASFDSAVGWARYYHGVEPNAPISSPSASPSSVACYAWNNGGSNWPADGDFGGNAPAVAVEGDPVGPWPFDSSGNYIGA